MRYITGTIKSTPVQWLPVLSNIAPPKTRRLAALKAQYQKCQMNPSLPINTDVDQLNQGQLRLKSRNPPTRTANNLLDNFTIDEHWMDEWNEAANNAHLIVNPTVKPNGFSLPRREWCNLNRIRVDHGVCNKSLNQWGIADSPLCDKCNAAEQTVYHIVQECPATRYEGSLNEIHQLTPEAIEWLRGCNVPL